MDAARVLVVQVLRGRETLPKARRDAMAAAANAKEFVSHCAAEGGDTVTPEKMTVAQLRAALLVCCSYHGSARLMLPYVASCFYWQATRGSWLASLPGRERVAGWLARQCKPKQWKAEVIFTCGCMYFQASLQVAGSSPRPTLPVSAALHSLWRRVPCYGWPCNRVFTSVVMHSALFM